MLEILFVTVTFIGGIWAVACLIDRSAKLRRIENDRFLKKYERLVVEAERQRSAKEMAAMIMLIEQECKRRR